MRSFVCFVSAGDAEAELVAFLPGAGKLFSSTCVNKHKFSQAINSTS